MSEEIISVTAELIQTIVPPRLVSSKKGDNGIVLVIGGSRIYHGAPLLSTLAALRSGVDLVYTAVPKSNIVPTRSFSPNVIVLPLPTDRFTVGSAKQLIKILPKKPDVVAIGMGMAIEKPESLVYMVKELNRMGTKLLLDASALIPEILEHISGSNTVITPHPGEYKRLFQKEKNYEEIINTRTTTTTTTTTTIQEQTSNVCKLARKYGITIILKGYDNIICNGGIKKEQQQQQSIAVIKRTTPAMTVGGCGDVLSGVVAGLFAKMQDAFSASVAAVYLSGMAADLAYQRVGLHMVATDIIDELPNAIKPFDKIE